MTTQQIYAKGDTKPFIDLLFLFLSSNVLVWLCVCVCVLVTDRIQQLGMHPSLVVVIVIASSLSALLLSVM